MKKILLLAASCLMLAACKKENNNGDKPATTEVKKYPVTFSVSDFAQSVVKLSNKATLATTEPLKDHASFLYYRIYNSSNVQINQVDQKLPAANFGSIKDTLREGTYNVFIGASKSALGLPSPLQIWDNASYSCGTGLVWDDTFAKSFKLTVGKTAVTQSVQLDRTMGGLELTLTDAIPSNITKITLIFDNEAVGLRMASNANASYSASLKEFTISASDIGIKNKKFFRYIGNVTSASSVVIRAYDSSNRIIEQKTVPNVRCYKNQKTSLSGALFSSATSAANSFDVVVNPEWGADSTPIKF